MATYHEEHNIPTDKPPAPTNARPDLSSFFALFNEIPPDDGSRNNPHAVPMRSDRSALYAEAAAAYRPYLTIAEESGLGIETPRGEIQPDYLMQRLVQDLESMAENPPDVIDGVSDQFLTDLERVPRAQLQPADACPICNTPFLEDKYALVVRLPCHRDHLFDLECITPWLKLKATCPLDRKNLKEKKEPVIQSRSGISNEDEESDYDDMFA